MTSRQISQELNPAAFALAFTPRRHCVAARTLETKKVAVIPTLQVQPSAFPGRRRQDSTLRMRYAFESEQVQGMTTWRGPAALPKSRRSPCALRRSGCAGRGSDSGQSRWDGARRLCSTLSGHESGEAARRSHLHGFLLGKPLKRMTLNGR